MVIFGALATEMPGCLTKSHAKENVTMLKKGLSYLKNILVNLLMSLLTRFFMLDFQNTTRKPSMTQRRLYRMYMASFLKANMKPIFPDDEEEEDEYYK